MSSENTQPDLLESIPAMDWEKGIEVPPTPAGVEIDFDHQFMEE